MKNRKALIVMGFHYSYFSQVESFMPPGDNTIIPKINDLLTIFDIIIFTPDWSTDITKDVIKDYADSQILNYKFHPDIDLSKCKKDFYIFKKEDKEDLNPYSAFSNTGLKEFLDKKHVSEVYVCGLSAEYCCKDTAIDSVKSGYSTYIVRDACKSTEKDIKQLLIELIALNVYYIDYWVLNFLTK